MRWLVALLVCVGCGRVAFDPLAASDAVNTPDVACAYGPFSAPVKLPGPIQSAVDDWVPRSALDNTQLFFCSFAAPALGSCDLFYATRPDTSSQYSAPIHITELSTTGYEGGPGVTNDGLDMVFYRLIAANDLYETTRAAVTDSWSTPVPLAFNTTSNEQDASLTPDGLDMIFSSNRAGSLGGSDLWESTRASRSAPWSAPTRLTTISSTSDDESPTISSDGLELLFSSRRTGGPGLLDVYTASRQDRMQAFGTPSLLPQLSSANDDIGVTLASDGLSLYLNFDTLTAGGRQSDIWLSTRTCN